MESALLHPDMAIPNSSSFENYFSYTSELLNCLEPLLLLHGWSGNKRQIAELLPHFSETLDINDFCKIMHDMDYEKQTFRIQLNRLDNRLAPCLFISLDDHCLIIKEVKENSIVAFDGRLGKDVILDIKDCNIRGTIYLFRENENFNFSNRGKQTWLSRILVQFKPLIYQILVISLVLNLLSLTTPLFVMVVYDKVINSESITMLVNLSIGLLIALFGIFILQGIRSKILAYIGAQLDSIVGNSIFQHLVFLPTRYTENATVGAQVSRIKDFDTVREFFTGPFVTLIFEAPFTLIFLALLWYLGGIVIILPIFMLCLFAFTTLLIQPMIHRSIQKSSRTSSARHEFLIESLSNYRALKYCATEDVWLERHRKLTANASYSNFKATIITSVINAIADTMMMVTGVGVIALGVLQVINGAMSMGALIATMILVWKILTPIKTIFANLSRIDQVRASIAQINSLMDITPERDLSSHLKPDTFIQGDIEFNRVSLRYQTDLEPALIGVQFHAKPGELVMITGNNGSGKSTLLKLILRLYTPQAGGVRVDGKDIRQVDCGELRQAIGYVPQVNQFFYGTIAQNLRLANPVASDEEIIAACKLAGLYADIESLPDGINTRLRDQNKQSLSASFQQRLTLARAYVKKPRILILDEPTNNLDEESVKAFLHALAFFRRKTTILMVTHRPSFFKLADRLMYLEQGHLICNGSPAEISEKIRELES